METVHDLLVGGREQYHLNSVDDDDRDDEQVERRRRGQRVHGLVKAAANLHRWSFSVLQTDRRQLYSPELSRCWSWSWSRV